MIMIFVDAPIGTTVKVATANDVDIYPNLTYTFGQNGNPENMFSIDQFTGHIALAKSLDREKKEMYSISIEVRVSYTVIGILPKKLTLCYFYSIACRIVFLN